MSIEEYSIKVQKTARYHFAGIRGQQPEEVWFVLHGYGQMTPYFIRHFEPFATEKRWFIAPEGLHRFYLEGTSGRVGASWMTKENREDDIRDYLEYLNNLMASLKLPAECHINILGFSQGAATAGRWFQEIGQKVQRLVMYAGVFPNDFQLGQFKYRFSKTAVAICFGDEDEFATEERLHRELSTIKEFLPEITVVRFKGGHRIYPEVLEGLFSLS